MMKSANLLPAGDIVTTHGVQGELRLRPAVDSPEFLLSLPVFYLDGKPLKLQSARAHKGMLLITLLEVDSVDAAMPYLGKTLYFNRADKPLPENTYYIADLMGLLVEDLRTNRALGKIINVLQPPAHDVYVVSDGESEVLIPAAPGFVEGVFLAEGKMVVRTIEGMGDDVAD